MIDQAMVRSLLNYDPETGLFVWLSGHRANKPAGCKQGKGYVHICIDQKLYKAHRLAFLYMTGNWPTHHVDHINRIKDDNRWENLRDVPQRINLENRAGNASFIGVSWMSAKRRWYARSPKIAGKIKHLGSFKTHLAACYARHAYNLEGCHESA